MPATARAFFTVTAGIIPDEPMPEYTLRVDYTSQDREADRTDLSGPAVFEQRRDQAMAHARELMDPSAVNWVRLEFIWL